LILTRADALKNVVEQHFADNPDPTVALDRAARSDSLRGPKRRQERPHCGLDRS
jgi:hypothetical protein